MSASFCRAISHCTYLRRTKVHSSKLRFQNTDTSARGKAGKCITAIVFFTVFLTFIFAVPVFGDTKIVDGTMTFRFEVKSSKDDVLDSFYEYENNSNSQKVVERRSGRIVVETKAKLDPFESDIPFPVGDRYRREEFSEYLDMSTSRSGVRIERKGSVVNRTEFVEKTPTSKEENLFLRKRTTRVTSGANTQHKAVERVMRHIRAHVSYQLETSSNPVDVLKSGKAYCEGYANTAALMLRSIGVPARVMDSYIPPGHMWGYGQEGSGGFHAHVEVYYDDAGWVSYDPQATIHYVDPYHIVNYPRRNVRMVQLEENDNRHIVDRLYIPGNWDNFYRRKTEERRHAPLLVGEIYTRKGRKVEDSFRSDEWVYTRNESGEGRGIRILANGTFAVSPPQGEDSVTFFYRDGNGGWVEETVSFDGNERTERTYRLDEAERGYTLHLESADTLYLWYKDNRRRDRIDSVQTGSNGNIVLFSNKGRWIVSRSDNVMAPRYLLDVENLERGESYALAELPSYYDPDTVYASGRVAPPRGEDVSVRLIRDDGARTEPVPVPADGKFAVPLPNNRFSAVLLQGPAMIGIKKLSSSSDGTPSNGAALPKTDRKNPSSSENVSDSGGEKRGPDFPDITEGSNRYIVETGRSGSTVYLVKKIGRRFSEYGRAEVNSEGEATLYVDPAVEKDVELYVLLGTPQITAKKPIEDAEEGRILFE